MWAVIIAAVSVFMVTVAHTVVTALSGATSLLISMPGLKAFLPPGGHDASVHFIAVFWCGETQHLLAGLVAQMVSSWASDDTGGVLAAQLTRPVSRVAVVLERAGAGRGPPAGCWPRSPSSPTSIASSHRFWAGRHGPTTSRPSASMATPSGPPYWTGLWVMLAIVAVGFGLAAWGMGRRDVV